MQYRSFLPCRPQLSGKVLRRGVAAVVGACALVALHAPARADIIWNFSFNATINVPYTPYYQSNPGAPITASGQLTTTDLGGNIYRITDITGTYDGMAISLLPVGDYADNDNLLFTAKPFYLDGSGLSFTAGGHSINLYYGVNGAYSEAIDPAEYEISDNGSFTISAIQESVPEPASLALFATALVGLGVMRRRTLD